MIMILARDDGFEYIGFSRGFPDVGTKLRETKQSQEM